MACHSRHRVFVRLVCSLALKGVHLWIVGNHRLVHAVEGHLHAVGRPEESPVAVELVAVHGLSVYYFAAAVGGELLCPALGVGYVEVVALYVCHGLRLGVPFGSLFLLALLAPDGLLLLEVYEHALVLCRNQHEALVGIRELYVAQVAHLVVFVGACPFVEFVGSEEHCLLAVRLVHELAVLGVAAHELVAPPRQIPVFGNHVVEVVAAEVEVFKRELFVLCHSVHGR